MERGAGTDQDTSSWGMRLLPVDDERRFRRERLSDDLRHNVLVICLLSVAMLIFVRTDFRLFGTASTFWWLLAARLAHIAVGGAVIAGLRSCKQPACFDRLSLAWVLLSAILVSAVDATRPPDYFGYLTIDIVLVFVVYNVYSMPLAYQAIGGGAFTAGCFATLLLSKEPAGTMEITAYLMSLAMANLLGALASHRIQAALRTAHLTLHREREAHEAVKRAHREIRQLRGIVPICAACKKVRDDAGFWNQVEIYIAERTDAQFSHGLCPDCVQELYPRFRPSEPK